ncbi:MAG TPA: matrixin family metalloprotease, partial [Anaeromyxobacteraceae bacterium]|nr:matrixin family metalloprotease [Anaeromyxobacteraceae bacterium]
MSGAPRLALALALLAGGSARAYVRTTTASNDPRHGACLYWPQAGFTYRVNASGFTGAGCAGAADAASLLRASFAPWMQASRGGAACSGFHFADGGDTQVTALGNDGVNLVVLRRGLCSSFAAADPDCAVGASPEAENRCIAAHDCWSHGTGAIIALTTATFRVETGEIVDADTELHAWNADARNPTGWYFTCAGAGSGICPTPPYGSASCIYIDVGTTMTHEAGHMLGLDHVCAYSGTTCDSSSVMFPNTSPGKVVRALGADDVAGVCDIYPAGGAPSASAGCLGQPAPPSSSGCSSGGAAGGLAVLALAALALRRRRSRPWSPRVRGDA